MLIFWYEIQKAAAESKGFVDCNLVSMDNESIMNS